ncbi:type I 3-dehydroquinate dehydratase [Bacillus horti]|uniref:3-dehydroquinate dehydratase n=1 Tax=Caldalkalibacillus horti TaxID=77523 RepID=A0ABT9W1B3_9BACI|nr:type I 3-dehydroquinate dehydratase [Bacillus horti]MDQ0166991.1 3-dehydroquinate dehydratase-1 [Bacillus horti]
MSLQQKSIMINGKNIINERPQIVVPIISSQEEAILKECEQIVSKKPDLIEWRADFFTDLADVEKVKHIIGELKLIAQEIPIIFTIRSVREGGQEISLDEDGVVRLLISVSRDAKVDFVDFELSNKASNLQKLKEVTDQSGTQLIVSYHNFQQTPPKEFITKTFADMQKAGANLAKLAAMPQSFSDVVTLLQCTEEANQQLDVPIISMSMGDIGVVSRVVGWQFGSVFTFAIGSQSSAPGQVPIEDLRQLIAKAKIS